MQFSKVIGQEGLKRELPELLRQNRLAHALLFLSKEGSGALPLALAFAQYIVCERNNKPAAPAGPSLFGEDVPAGQPAFYPDSCGECPACLKAAELVHPDIHFTYPVVTKKSGTPPLSADYVGEWREFVKNHPYGNVYDWLQFIGAENKQGNITAQECNYIIKKLSLKSFEGGYKILLLWLPEYLGNEGNKLLKLIEEPPEKTVFLLVTENEGLILPTILSRCQLIKVPQPTEVEITTALIERNHTDKDAAAQIAGICGGNYREALQLVRHSNEDWQGLLRDWLNSILRTGPVAQVKWVEEISKLGRENQKQFLRYFNHLLLLAVRLGVAPALGKDYSEKDRDFATRLYKLCDISQLEALAEELNMATYYIERNANSKMLFLGLTIKFYHIIRDKVVFLNE
ncbi:MAG: hypothetical protein QM727_05270 [Niabella sp.]